MTDLGNLSRFRECILIFLAPIKITLDVNDYELKVREVTMGGCLSLVIFSYMGVYMEQAVSCIELELRF